MPSGPGFGNVPQSFALRVKIVGYASPRFRGAKNAAEADRLNFELSAKRAQSVRAVVERELRAKLGNNIKIEYAVSTMEPRNAQGIEIGSYGAGSHDALTAAKGDRNSNAEIDRKVEVTIEKITTAYTTGTVSLGTGSLTGKTDWWGVKITKLRVIAAGVAVGSIDVVLHNRFTNKTMYATADLYGGGIGGGVAKAADNIKKQIAAAVQNNLKQALSDFIGRGEMFFLTKDKMEFKDFHDTFIRVGKVNASLIVRSTHSYMTLPSIIYHPKELVIESKIGIGFPNLEAWAVTGKLKLRGPHLGEDWEYEKTNQVNDSYDKHWQESLILTFPTNKWELQPNDKLRLTDFVAVWARRFL